MNFCPECGEKCIESAKFCHKCGYKLIKSETHLISFEHENANVMSDEITADLSDVMKQTETVKEGSAHVQAFQSRIKEMVANANLELAGPLHDKFMDSLLERNLFSDIGLEVQLNSFALQDLEQKKYVEHVYDYFKWNDSDIHTYYRNALGIDFDSGINSAEYKDNNHTMLDTLETIIDFTSPTSAIKRVIKYLKN